MAGQQREMEGDNRQRRKAAREARSSGVAPSEVGGTLGASKQRKEARGKAGHRERVEQKREGKQAKATGTSGKPRPGSREKDPKRTDRWR